METSGICTRDQALEKIAEAAKAVKGDARLTIYYTGHGAIDSGDWVFDKGSDGKSLISLKQLLTTCSENGSPGLIIYSDACYGKHWVDKFKEENIRMKYSTCCNHIYSTDANGQAITWST